MSEFYPRASRTHKYGFYYSAIRLVLGLLLICFYDRLFIQGSYARVYETLIRCQELVKTSGAIEVVSLAGLRAVQDTSLGLWDAVLWHIVNLIFFLAAMAESQSRSMQLVLLGVLSFLLFGWISFQNVRLLLGLIEPGWWNRPTLSPTYITNLVQESYQGENRFNMPFACVILGFYFIDVVNLLVGLSLAIRSAYRWGRGRGRDRLGSMTLHTVL